VLSAKLIGIAVENEEKTVVKKIKLYTLKIRQCFLRTLATTHLSMDHGGGAFNQIEDKIIITI
jgi:hypothetical protein